MFHTPYLLFLISMVCFKSAMRGKHSNEHTFISTLVYFIRYLLLNKNHKFLYTYQSSEIYLNKLEYNQFVSK